MKNFIFSFIIPMILAILSGMGVGGGGLFAVYLKFSAGGEQIEIQAINLLFFLFAAGAAVLLHLLRRKIYFGAVTLCTLFGVAGSLIGSFVASQMKSRLLSTIFGLTLISVGVFSLVKAAKDKKTEQTQNVTKK